MVSKDVCSSCGAGCDGAIIIHNLPLQRKGLTRVQKYLACSDYRPFFPGSALHFDEIPRFAHLAGVDQAGGPLGWPRGIGHRAVTVRNQTSPRGYGSSPQKSVHAGPKL